MKKRNVIAMLCALCVLTLLLPMQTNAASAKKNKKAMTAYHQFLSQDQIQWSEWTSIPSSDVLFAAADINKDGVKELIV